jgi:hypothetical protein
VANPSDPGLFFVRNSLMASISLLVIHLFKRFISFWFNFGGSNGTRNLSLYSRFSNFFGYRFSKCSLMILWISLVFVVLFPFSPLILLIWVLSLLLLIRLTKDLSILFIFSKTQLFASLVLHISFLVSSSIISILIHYFLQSANFVFVLFFCYELKVHIRLFEISHFVGIAAYSATLSS